MKGTWNPSLSMACSALPIQRRHGYFTAWGILVVLMSCTTTLWGQPAKTARVITTAESTNQRLADTGQRTFQLFGQPVETQPCIFVDPSESFQTFLGIGGAITDAAAETYANIPASQQAAFLKAYFSPTEGIGYTFCRTNINSCDFSSASYTYVREGDASLASFSLAPDEQYKIPLIQKAKETAGAAFKLFASPWSPPAWMKDNNNMLQGGSLKPAYYQSWADYFVRFIQGYEKKGIPIWGISVQNEPMAKQTWESCIFTAEQERDFIRDYLGPTLQKNGLSSRKLIAWDHNRDLLYHRAATLLHDQEAARYIWGIGFHWYEAWNGGWQFDNLRRSQEAFPDKAFLLTEACNFPFSWETFNQWKWGEIYGQNMIQDFNNGAVAWTDWNILLDEKGGPNHVGNYCFAPVHAKTKDGSLHFMNSYYYIGHFSKYIQPGAKRIISSSNRAQLLTTAFQNPDGSVAVVVMNQTEEKFAYRLYQGNQAVELEILPHAIQTILF
ncbi:MAG: glycoside hydrolase family 30 protein [Haliscomenobacter sp.]